MVDFGSIVFAQLRYLVANINKRNQRASVSEIAHLLWLYGESAFVFLLCCLFEEIDFRDPKLQKDQLKAQLLAQEFAKLTAKPNFVTLFCEILSKAQLQTAPLQEDFLHAVAKAVKATSAQQLAMGLGLAQCAEPTLRAEGAKFLRTRLNDLTAPPGGREAVAALPEDLGHALTFFLERQEGFAKQRAALMKLHVRAAPAQNKKMGAAAAA